MSVLVRKKNGKWYVFINHNGRRKSKAVGPDKASAEAVARKIREKLCIKDLGDELGFQNIEDFAMKIVNDILTQMFCHNFNRRIIGSHLRMAILIRDKERCVKCGKNGKGTILEVDHIIPVSQGGLTIASNLQTLCKDCNIGKSNIFK